MKKKIHMNAAYLDHVLPPMSDTFVQGAKRTLDSLPEKEEPIVRKKISMGLVLAMMLLVLMISAGVAALNWGSRNYIEGNGVGQGALTHEALFDLIEPIGERVQGALLDVTMVDAIYDGRTATLAWTVKNTGDETLYLLCDIAYLGEEESQHGQSSMNDTNIFLAPGEQIESGVRAYALWHFQEEAPTCEVKMRLTAMRTLGEIVELYDTDPYTGGEMSPSAGKVDAAMAEGKVVISFDQVELGSHADENIELALPERLEAMGLMAIADDVGISFTLDAAKPMQAISQAEQVLNLGDVTVSLDRAEMTPASFFAQLRLTFPNEEVKNDYMWDCLPDDLPDAFWRGRVETKRLWFQLQGPDGEPFFDSMAMLGTGVLDEMEGPDGSWEVVIELNAAEYSETGKVCRIVPTIIDMQTKERTTFSEDVAIELTFE